MQCEIALFVILVALVLRCAAVNYCGAKMCGHTNAHTLCQFHPGPSPFCMGYMPAALSVEEKNRVLARLNRRRSEAASGTLRGLPTAGNMLKLRWVEELAREAQRWADQCRLPRTPEEHDACRDLYSISVGQAVASVVGEAPGLRVESMVDMWYMQGIRYKGNVTSYIIPFNNGSYYGDFAQITWSRTYMVGCGRSRFMSPWYGRVRSVERLVCNFAPRGPIPHRTIWSPAPPASVCPPRSQPDEQYPALCNFPETVRELQEALDRMESALETTNGLPPHSGKVRRELREFPKDNKITTEHVKTDDDDNFIPFEDRTLTTVTQVSDQNNTIDRTPMLSMVLKYMPYLKQYEKGILGHSSSESTRLAPTFLIVVSVCLRFNCI